MLIRVKLLSYMNVSQLAYYWWCLCNRYPLELRKDKSVKDKVDLIFCTFILPIYWFFWAILFAIILLPNEMGLQLRKTEQNCTNGVEKKLESLEDSEFEESSIEGISQDIASKVTVADKPEGKSKESGAKLDIQSSLPEVLILDQNSYKLWHYRMTLCFYFCSFIYNWISPNFLGSETLWTD